MNSIDDRQKEIIEEFAMLDGDMEMSINYLIEQGEQLPDLPEENKTEENIVKGCQSKVWLTSLLLKDGTIDFKADSNTVITKGLVSLLIRALSGQTPKDILDSEIYFPEKIGMSRFIGSQRSNGFKAMIKQMKIYALAFTTKVNA